MRLMFAALAAAGLAATPAFAADGTGFYVGAGVGDYGIKPDGNSFDAKDFGCKVFGGHNFIKYLGAEIEYIDGGSPSDQGTSIDMYGFNFSAVGIWPVIDQFGLRGEYQAFENEDTSDVYLGSASVSWRF